MTFIALIVLGAQSTKMASEESFRTWSQKEDSIQFPKFNFRLAHDEVADRISQVHCNFFGTNGRVEPVLYQACDKAPQGTCYTINADLFEGKLVIFVSPLTNEMIGVQGKYNESVIDCNVTLTTPGHGADKVLGFEIFNDAEFGVAWTWMFPNDKIWLLLSKTEVGGSSHVKWRRNLVYHSTEGFRNSSFHVSVKMEEFHVLHMEKVDSYNRWMSVGDIGGYVVLFYYDFWFLLLNSVAKLFFFS
jgi:hypothetical protein